MTNWTDIAALEDIPKLGSRVLKTDTVNIALFRTAVTGHRAWHLGDLPDAQLEDRSRQWRGTGTG